MLKLILSSALLLSIFWIFVPADFLGTHKRKKAFILAIIVGIVISRTNESDTSESRVAERAAVSSPSQRTSSRTTDLRQGLLGGERVEVIQVTAPSLFREYERNEVATDMRLKGKIVEISGRITGINKDIWDSAYVELQTPNQFMSATVRPIKSEIDKIARLQKGQFAAFRCEDMGRFFGSPSGKKCILAD